jgi:hypothetical protein
MKKNTYFVWKLAYDNSLDAFVPEAWAQESLAILEENMVIGKLVHRDFNAEIAKFGDVVNTRSIGEFSALRKDDRSDITLQDATATNIAVPLDQHLHTSFVIKDGEQSKSFKNLIEEYLQPAVLSIAQQVDRILLGQAAGFLENTVGEFGNFTATNAKEQILKLRQEMNTNKVPMNGRYLILNPAAETAVLTDDAFTDADRVGDNGSALREASLGRKLGFDMFMCQNMAYPSGGTTTAGSADTAGAVGDVTLGVTAGGNETIGHWVVVDGDAIPRRVYAASAGASISVYPALREVMSSSAVITHYTQADVNQATASLNAGGTASASGYRAGWHGPIVYDGGPLIVVGQLITFGVAATTGALVAAQEVYTVIDVDSTTGFTLDRPLAAAIANDSKINPGPMGGYNFAFNKHAVAFVSRPLALPMAGAGARAAVANFNDLSIRICITYDGTKQGHIVTVDMLCGVKKLSEARGAVLLN